MCKHQAFLEHLKLQVILWWATDIAAHLTHPIEDRRTAVHDHAFDRLQHVQRCQESPHPQDVIQMFMAQHNAGQVFETNIGTQDLPLCAFTAIDEPF